mgnify:CR=1 FL=1
MIRWFYEAILPMSIILVLKIRTELRRIFILKSFLRVHTIFHFFLPISNINMHLQLPSKILLCQCSTISSYYKLSNTLFARFGHESIITKVRNPIFVHFRPFFWNLAPFHLIVTPIFFIWHLDILSIHVYTVIKNVAVCARYNYSLPGLHSLQPDS